MARSRPPDRILDRVRTRRAKRTEPTRDRPDRASGRACASCAAPLVGRFCAHCGEKAPSPHDYELSGLLHDAAHELFHLDGKLVRSLVALFTKPGLLAQEYFAGRRSRYARPLSLFVFLNVVFFVVQPHTGLLNYRIARYVGVQGRGEPNLARRIVEAKLVRTGEDPEVYAARFDATLQEQKKGFLIVTVPVFALLLALLEADKRRRYAEHLVFAIHYYAVVFASLLAIVLVVAPLVVAPAFRLALWLGLVEPSFAEVLDGEPMLVGAQLAMLGPYLYLGLRRFYGDGRAGAAARALVLFVGEGLLLVLFSRALFWTAYWAT